MRLPLPLTASADGARIAVRLQPKASRAGIDGIVLDAGGRAFLRVRVTEPPEGGKANRALIKLLAKALQRPPSDLDVVGGHKDRNKTVAVKGGAETINHIKDWLGAFHE